MNHNVGITAASLEWNVAYTRHQHEKSVAENLTGKGFEVFLPTYDVMRRWSDRKKQVTLPLFPCYVFVRSNFERRFGIITTPGIHLVIMFAGRPATVPDHELDAIRKALQSNLRVEPHPFLRCGDWVRVTSGPLIDVEGILIRKKSSCRLVLSVELLGKSAAVEIDAFSVKPVPRRATRTPLLSAHSELIVKQERAV